MEDRAGATRRRRRSRAASRWRTMQARAVDAVRRRDAARRGRARRRRGLGGGQPRRRDQVGARRRPRHAPRPVPADQGRPGVDLGGPLHRRRGPSCWRPTPTRATCPGWPPRSRRAPGEAPRRRGRRRRRAGPAAAARRPPHRVGDMAPVDPRASTRPSASSRAPSARPAQRTFFLQARTGARVTSVALEKQQVAVLAERIDELLDEVMASTGDGDARSRRVAPRRAGGHRAARAADRRGVPRRHDDPVVGPRRRAGGDRGLPLHRGRGRRPEDAEEEIEEPEPEEIFLVRLAGRRWRGPSCKRAAAGGRGRPASLPVLRQPDRPRRATCARGPTASAAATRPDRTRLASRVAEHELLDRGEIELHGRIMPASNATFVGRDRRRASACVYKPVAGERPLWDFPDGTLAGREVAAYVVSEALGWDVVPADRAARRARTGPGMVQVWREPDPGQDAGRPGAARAACREGYLHVLDGLDGRRPAGLAGPRGQRRAAPDGGLRRRGQQRRPQGRARAGDDRRAPLRRRPRR